MRKLPPSPEETDAPVSSTDISTIQFTSQRARDAVVRAALKDLRDDLGFHTASLFVGDPAGWKLIHRVGPHRAWHALLDPSVIEATKDAAQYGDVRALPGAGSRLAAMGCGSLAVLPIPGGGRILLDSSTASIAPGWVERARPYLTLLAAMSGPAWTLDGALRGHEEVGAIERIFEVCQAHVADEASTIDSLLEGVRDALRADEVYLLSQVEGMVEVNSAPAAAWPALPADLPKDIWPAAHETIDGADLRRLVPALGISSSSLAGAFGRQGGHPEALVAGWREGPALSAVSMTMVARAVSTTRLAVQGRRDAVDVLLEQERNEIAYALHDDLLQTVTGAVLELEGLARRIEHDPAGAVAALNGSKAEIRRALKDLRASMFRLSNDGQDARAKGSTGKRSTAGATGFVRSVEDVIARWRLPARVTVEGDLDGLPERVLSIAYVVVRELLANAAKHSAGSSVTVGLEAGRNELKVVVADRGHGFTPREERAARQDHHLGLQMLRTRVKETGGTLIIDSQPGRGTRVIASLPISEVKP